MSFCLDQLLVQTAKNTLPIFILFNLCLEYSASYGHAQVGVGVSEEVERVRRAHMNDIGECGKGPVLGTGYMNCLQSPNSPKVYK